MIHKKQNVLDSLLHNMI